MSSIYCQPCEERRWSKSLPRQKCQGPSCPNYKPPKRARRGLKGIVGS